MSDLKKMFGSKVRNIRKEKGYSQIKFAELIGISTNALSLIETGTGFCTAETLNKILVVLDVEPAELFSFGVIKSDDELFNNILRKLEIIKTRRKDLEIIDTILSKLL
jgi:transcriptional regulator with XRE-family HTH domain